jgi:hypothetical protein
MEELECCAVRPLEAVAGRQRDALRGFHSVAYSAHFEQSLLKTLIPSPREAIVSETAVPTVNSVRRSSFIWPPIDAILPHRSKMTTLLAAEKQMLPAC